MKSRPINDNTLIKLVLYFFNLCFSYHLAIYSSVLFNYPIIFFIKLDTPGTISS